MDKIYIINTSNPLSGGRKDFYVVGLENAKAEYNDCKKNGETPKLYDTIITPTGLIMRGDKICG